MDATFCPHCGNKDTLRDAADDEAIGHVEKGCYDGSRYCYEGPLPTLQCDACGFTFAIDVTEDEIHDDCSCGQNALCGCGRYRRARALRGLPGSLSDNDDK